MSERDCLGRRALIDRSEQVRKVDQRAGFRTWHCRLPYVEEYNSMEQKTIGRRCTKCDLKDYSSSSMFITPGGTKPKGP
jgi:hypothetical protein